jgi:hypothetical protein
MKNSNDKNYNKNRFQVFEGKAYVKEIVGLWTLETKREKAIDIARSIFGLDLYPGVHSEYSESGYESLIQDYLEANTETKDLNFMVIEERDETLGLSKYTPTYKE